MPIHKPAHKNTRPRLWVPPGGIETGRGGETLSTGGVGACIEIAVLDRINNIGHMAHMFSTIGSQQTTFTKLEARLGSHDVDPSNLTAWMTGGSSEASLSQRATLRDRAVERLAELGLHPGSNLHLAWNDDERLLLTAQLDCETGEHTVSARPLPYADLHAA